MGLNEYLCWKDGKLDRSGEEARRIAQLAKTTPYYLYMLALGHKSPSLAMAQRIASATQGNVGLADWPNQKAA